MARPVAREHWVPSASRVAWNHFLTWKSYNLPRVAWGLTKDVSGHSRPSLSWFLSEERKHVNYKQSSSHPAKPGYQKATTGPLLLRVAEQTHHRPPHFKTTLQGPHLPTWLHFRTMLQGPHLPTQLHLSSVNGKQNLEVFFGGKNMHEFKNISECLQCVRHKRYRFEEHKCHLWGITF